VAQPDEENDAEHAFGKAVRDVRRTRGWTQEQLRRRLLDGYGIDLSKTAMARLELGQRPIRLNEVHAIAQLLGIDMSGFGREPSVGERLNRGARVANERLAAVQQEIRMVSDALARADTERMRLIETLQELNHTASVLDKIYKVMVGNQQDSEWAVKALDELLGTDRADGER
jgi:transcriptional regulator with XRE-family HTH domain